MVTKGNSGNTNSGNKIDNDDNNREITIMAMRCGNKLICCENSDDNNNSNESRNGNNSRNYHSDDNAGVNNDIHYIRRNTKRNIKKNNNR